MTTRDDGEQVEIELVHVLVRAEQMCASLSPTGDEESQTWLDTAGKSHTAGMASSVPTSEHGEMAGLMIALSGEAW